MQTVCMERKKLQRPTRLSMRMRNRRWCTMKVNHLTRTVLGALLLDTGLHDSPSEVIPTRCTTDDTVFAEVSIADIGDGYGSLPCPNVYQVVLPLSLASASPSAGARVHGAPGVYLHDAGRIRLLAGSEETSEQREPCDSVVELCKDGVRVPLCLESLQELGDFELQTRLIFADPFLMRNYPLWSLSQEVHPMWHRELGCIGT